MAQNLDQAAGLELERATLGLINMVAYASSSRAHARGFAEATGVVLATSDVRLLEYLSGRDVVPTSTLAHDLGIDLSQASRQARLLSEAGYVDRQTDPADRRRTLLRLTAAGLVLLDEWLLAWSADYRDTSAEWQSADLVALDHWFRRVRDSLVAALPDRPASSVPDRWLALTENDGLRPDHRALTATVVGLVSWVGQSGGFNDLLEAHGVPLRQHAFFTLVMVSQHGPLSVAEVADRMGVDHSQASKRLSQLVELGLVDRAVDSFDRRSNLVRVSRRGAALERRVLTAQLEGFAGILGETSPADQDLWTALTRRYLDELVSTSLRSQNATTPGRP